MRDLHPTETGCSSVAFLVIRRLGPGTIAVVPGRSGLAVLPKACLPASGLFFQAFQLTVVPGMLSIPPGEAGLDQFMVQTAPIRQVDLADESLIPVDIQHLKGHGLVFNQGGRKGLSLLSEGLALFWAVDGKQTNRGSFAVLHHDETVPILNVENLAFQLFGLMVPPVHEDHGQEQQHGEGGACSPAASASPLGSAVVWSCVWGDQRHRRHLYGLSGSRPTSFSLTGRGLESGEAAV